MNKFEEYQKQFLKYNISAQPIEYYIIGLAGETGEFVEKYKKIMRGEKIDDEEMIKELGDVLWYLTFLAKIFNSSLKEVAEKNIEKLKKRLEKGVVFGSGDNR